MKRLERLIKLTQYLSGFRLPGSEIIPLRVVNHDHATSRLAHQSGMQILIARPEVKHSGNSDSYTESFTTALFVLEKDLGPARTDQREDEQYLRLVELASDVLTQLERDAGDTSNPYLCSLTLDSVEVVPETSIFGGWSGYSIEVSFH